MTGNTGPEAGSGRAWVSQKTAGLVVLFVSGYWAASRRPTTSTAARACASETPGFSRASVQTLLSARSDQRLPATGWAIMPSGMKTSMSMNA